MALSYVENGISMHGGTLTMRSHSPPYRGGVGGGAGGLGMVGLAATSHLAATTPASPLYKGVSAVLVAEWQQKLKKNKKNRNRGEKDGD